MQVMVSLDMPWVHSLLLLATRLGTVALVAPPLASVQIPGTVRVAFVLTLSALLVGALQAAQLHSALAMGDMVPALGAEFAVGLALALGVALALAAFTAGAQLLDLQIGFGMGQVFDPLTRQRLPMLASAFSQLALLSFIAVEGHHALLRGVALSLERFPPGQGIPLASAAQSAVQQVGSAFTLGFAMVAPVVFCLFLVELGLGVLARNLPQMNLFALGMPVKVLIGLMALAVWLLGAGPVLSRMHAATFSAWKALLQP